MLRRSGRLEPQGTGTGPRALCPARLPAVDVFDSRMGIQNRIGEGKPRTPSSITRAHRDKTATGFGTAARSVQLGIAPGRSLYEQAVRDFDRLAWMSNPALTREVCDGHKMVPRWC
jgi:hypothetical protein